ncbi:golgin IMH1 isoform X2 [Juglans microcarpa x Juglans regia]|uniref:golgin IMH1 isoform X2 n=1 Tax=Juglans microcarpa x Juglans regia TaxID=2249226 RepID=UPI001B7DDE83|nr:golgin IMH1 isoform X2 [Juglans microcarpa x Juglans regia]
MGLLELSKFKLQLRSLITEVRDLRERERLATEQLHHQIQKQKQTEEEHGRKLQELQTEFAMSNEQRQKLERQVSYLQNDNTLLENKQKELKGTIQSLLQSREVFINAYEESTYELKRSVECRDRKLTVLSEKIRSHLLLFDSIEKEAFSIKQVINDVQCLVNEKEEVEKISDLQNKRKNDKDELRRKDRIISELDAHLEAARTSNNHQNQIQELQKTLSAKDVVIQNLISEKEALHIELGTVSIILQKIQDVVTNMHEEDKREFSLILKWQEGCDTVMKTEDNGTENLPQSKIEKFPDKVSDTGKENTASLLSEEYKKVGGPLQDQNTNGSCMSESTCSELQLAASIRSVSFDDGKDNCTSSVHHSDSESSTTQAETSGDPGAQV